MHVFLFILSSVAAFFEVKSLAPMHFFHSFTAGGVGALIHADRLRSKLPASVHTLHTLVDGSLFVDVPDVKNETMTAKLFKSVFELHNLAGMHICCEIK